MDSVSDYYSATQLRSDRWSALREVTSELARAPGNKISAIDRTRAQELFESLALIEPYWAFPGMASWKRDSPTSGSFRPEQNHR